MLQFSSCVQGRKVVPSGSFTVAILSADLLLKKGTQVPTWRGPLFSSSHMPNGRFDQHTTPVSNKAEIWPIMW